MRTVMAVCGVAVAFLGVAAAETARKPARPAQGEAVATVGGAPVTAAELDQHIGDRLLAARTSEYEVRRAMLRDLINHRLILQEATRRNLREDQLLAAEVDAKVAPVSEEEKRAQYEAIKDRVRNRPADQVIADIGTNLKEQRLAARRDRFAQELASKANVEILLDPPRAHVAPRNDRAQGPVNAPITIQEFSDFQCPYCARVEPTLKRIRERYGNSIRLVYRDFPLSFHADATKAAEGAACASDQGKFWEMHNKIFERQGQIGVDDIKQYASDLGLDKAAFLRCLDSGRKTADVKRDVEVAESVGITGTPAFLINGRLLTGAQPFESFAEIIDDELARARRTAVPRPDTPGGAQ